MGKVVRLAEQNEHAQARVARRALAEGDKAYLKAAEAMRAMADGGLSQREIAAQVGCSKTRVFNLLKALGQSTDQGVDFGTAYTDVSNPPKPPIVMAVEERFPGVRVTTPVEDANVMTDHGRVAVVRKCPKCGEPIATVSRKRGIPAIVLGGGPSKGLKWQAQEFARAMDVKSGKLVWSPLAHADRFGARGDHVTPEEAARLAAEQVAS